MRFLIALRRLISAISASDAYMQSIFEKHYYPEITPEKKKELQKLLDQEMFDRISHYMARSQLNRIPKGKYEEEDLISDFLVIMFEKPSDLWLKYIKPEQATSSHFTHLFSRIAKNEMSDLVTNIGKKRHKEKNIQSPTDEDYGLEKLFEKKSESPKPFEKQEINKIKDDLFAYIKEHDVKSGLYTAFLKAWWKRVQQVGMGEGILLKDIINDPEIEKFELAPSHLDNKYRELKRLIIKFFEKERDVVFTKQFKDKWQASENNNGFRVFIANFMLADNGFKTPEEFAKDIVKSEKKKEVDIASELIKVAKILTSRNWQYKLDIHDIWKKLEKNSEDFNKDTFDELTLYLAYKIKKWNKFKDFQDELETIVEQIEEANDANELDEAMEQLYDFGDYNSVWIKTF